MNWDVAQNVAIVALVVAVIIQGVTISVVSRNSVARGNTIDMLAERLDHLGRHLVAHDNHLGSHDALIDMVRTRVDAQQLDHNDLNSEVSEIRKMVSPD